MEHHEVYQIYKFFTLIHAAATKLFNVHVLHIFKYCIYCTVTQFDLL